MVEIILVHPDIPQNTGNIARTCAVTGAHLTLVRPLGFSMAERHLKRSGLDYWNEVQWQVVDDLEDVLKSPFYFFSSKATRPYTDITFTGDCQLIFGSETRGFPEEYYQKWEPYLYTIPMKEGARCLNLSNAAAIVTYEAYRQLGFKFS